jgi:hypothetical protein
MRQAPFASAVARRPQSTAVIIPADASNAGPHKMATVHDRAARSHVMAQGTAPAMRGGFVPWRSLPDASAPVPSESLDPPIRPLVDAINATGWARTVFSCGGHPEEPDAITTGRRQAHVDVIVRDARAWKTWVRHVRREAPAAVARAMARTIARRDPPRLRVAEGGLGPLPEWLAEVLGNDPRDAAHAPGPITVALATVANRLRLPWVPSVPTPWRYRRLVLEPVPYALDAEPCRALLDVAIGVATACLEGVATDMPRNTNR